MSLFSRRFFKLAGVAIIDHLYFPSLKHIVISTSISGISSGASSNFHLISLGAGLPSRSKQRAGYQRSPLVVAAYEHFTFFFGQKFVLVTSCKSSSVGRLLVQVITFPKAHLNNSTSQGEWSTTKRATWPTLAGPGAMVGARL